MKKHHQIIIRGPPTYYNYLHNFRRLRYACTILQKCSSNYVPKLNRIGLMMMMMMMMIMMIKMVITLSRRANGGVGKTNNGLTKNVS